MALLNKSRPKSIAHPSLEQTLAALCQCMPEEAAIPPETVAYHPVNRQFKLIRYKPLDGVVKLTLTEISSSIPRIKLRLSQSNPRQPVLISFISARGTFFDLPLPDAIADVAKAGRWYGAQAPKYLQAAHQLLKDTNARLHTGV